jgi:hypothetical protein
LAPSPQRTPVASPNPNGSSPSDNWRRNARENSIEHLSDFNSNQAASFFRHKRSNDSAMPERYPILRSRTNMLVKAETNMSRARQPVQIVPKGWEEKFGLPMATFTAARSSRSIRAENAPYISTRLKQNRFTCAPGGLNSG